MPKRRWSICSTGYSTPLIRRLLRSLRILSSEPRLHGARDTLSELAHRAHQLHLAHSPIFLPRRFSEGQLQELLAMRGPAVLVLQLPDDLLRLHIDNIGRREVGVPPIKSHRNPVGGCRRGERRPVHRPFTSVVVDQHSVIDVVDYPEFALIRSQRDAVAGTAMSKEPQSELVPVGPLVLPHLGGRL